MDSQHALNAKTGKWGDASPVKEIIAQISGLVKTLDYSSLTLRRQGSSILVSVKHSGEINYSFSDMRGGGSKKKIYYEYCFKDSHERIIEKFAADFGRLYKDCLIADGLCGFTGISLSYGADTDMELKEYEDYIRRDCPSY